MRFVPGLIYIRGMRFVHRDIIYFGDDLGTQGRHFLRGVAIESYVCAVHYVRRYETCILA